MSARYEITEHTADVGVRAFGKSAGEACVNAALGMLRLMIEPETVRPDQSVRIEVAGDDGVDLLVAWLQEVLYCAETRGFVFRDVELKSFSEWRIEATLRGEALDAERHEPSHEIKAVTWHNARLEQRDDQWIAEVVFEI